MPYKAMIAVKPCPCVKNRTWSLFQTLPKRAPAVIRPNVSVRNLNYETLICIHCIYQICAVSERYDNCLCVCIQQKTTRVVTRAREDGAPGEPKNAIAIPEGLRTAGSVFVLAGFLKILIVCFPFSTMAISMYFQGLCDLGTWAAIKMIPIAVGILALGKVIVDRKIHERRWAAGGIAFAGMLALLLSRWAFARPRPSPLDPALARYRQYAKQAAAAAAKKGEQEQTRRQLDPKLTERAAHLKSQTRFR